jgi:hypothetical protein
MSDDEKTFKVSPEECDKWAERLRRMAKAMEAKDGPDRDENMRMFATASALMAELAMQIRQDLLTQGLFNPFGTPETGEA